MICIVGAGPVGNYAGYLLSKEGYDVTILEEHPEVGRPIQCTGILTAEIEDLISIKKSLLANILRKVRVFSPDGHSVVYNLKKNNYIFYRDLFDQYTEELAINAGATLLYHHRFEGFLPGNERCTIKVKDIAKNSSMQFTCDYVIGADGPLSKVAHSASLFGRRRFWVSKQATVEGNFDKNCFDVFLGRRYGPDFFGWSVPENDKISRIGLGSEKTVDTYFYPFLKEFGGVVKDYQAGLIPMYDPTLKIQKDRIFLAGDAATQVKATTGGGIIPGMIAAKTLVENLNGDYEKAVKRGIGKELRTSLWIRKFLNRFDDKKYNLLVKILSKDSNKKLIEEHDREFPTLLATKLFLRNPTLLRFLF